MSTDRKNLFRTALLSSTATAVAVTALSYGTPAYAQDEEEIEQVIVTGSRIPRADLVSNSPVAVIGAEEFQLTGMVGVERVLNNLPQVVPGLTNTSNNPGGGFSTINLRGLGSNRTLVLVNGRRYIPATQGGTIDVNMIPAGMIERIDVVTGGASAVYGSDAIAGVVNFILKDDFEGFQVSSQFDISHKGDGESFNLWGMMGTNFADGRGNVTIFSEYYNQTPVFQGDRAFSFFACTDAPGSSSTQCGANLVPGGSSLVPEGHIFGSVSGADNLTGTTWPGGITFTPGGDAVQWFDPASRYNYAPANFLQLPFTRWSLAANSHYQINDDIRFYMETQFVNSQSDQELAPTPAFGTFTLTNDGNPFLTANAQQIMSNRHGLGVDSDGDGIDDTTSVFLGRRMLEAGSRRALNEFSAWRVVVGFDGEFNNGWFWDANYVFIRNSQLAFLQGNISVSRLQQALLVTTDANGNVVCTDTSQGCAPVNMFGFGNISEEGAAFVRVDTKDLLNLQTQVATVAIGGDLVELPAGPLGFALGAEWRDDQSASEPDFASATGDIVGFNAGAATRGGYNVWEIFSEFSVPLVEGTDWAEYIGLEAGLRWSKYSTAGTIWTYKAGGEWQINSDFRIRGLYQRAVRAPSVGELFAGVGVGFPGYTDPCDKDTNGGAGPDAATAAFCVAQGVSAAAIAGNTFDQANSQLEAFFGGNPNLTEEKSNTWTLGVVIQPEGIPNLSMTIDYFDIKITNAIGINGGGAQGVIDLCFASADLNNEFCQSFIRRASDQTIQDMQLVNANVAILTAKGYDLQIDYSFGLEDMGIDGELEIFWLGTHLNEALFAAAPGLDTIDCAGKFAGQCGFLSPQVDDKFVMRATYVNGPAQLSLRWRWIGSLADQALDAGTSNVVTNIPQTSYFDVSWTYDITDGMRFFGGVDNVLNKGPHQLGGNQQQANTLPNFYDVLGPRFFVGLTANF